MQFGRKRRNVFDWASRSVAVVACVRAVPSPGATWSSGARGPPMGVVIDHSLVVTVVEWLSCGQSVEEGG